MRSDDSNLDKVQLRSWRVPIRHFGYDIGRKGMKDESIIPFLLTLPRPTFFTLDWDYFNRNLRHARYCLVHLMLGGFRKQNRSTARE